MTTATKNLPSLIQLFERFGLDGDKIKAVIANKKTCPNLHSILAPLAPPSGPLPKSTLTLLLHLSSSLTKAAEPHLPFLADQVIHGALTSVEQVNAAISWVQVHSPPMAGSAAMSEFNQACGVGIIITPSQVRECIVRQLDEKGEELTSKRYALLSSLLVAVRAELKWAPALLVKEELEAAFLQRLGPKDDRDVVGKKGKKAVAPDTASTTSNKPATPPVQQKPSIAELAKSVKYVHEGALAQLHKPGGNPQLDPSIMEEHLKRTGGKVITRFPPEPNGFLHIGHAKAININFGYAAAHGGITYLRYDDTNPEAELEEYFTAIKNTVNWLGFEPCAITYSSDHFGRLYDLAVELIKRDKAYICHCTGEEIHAHRGGDDKGPRSNCVHRDRPIQESLTEFARMKEGHYKEGEAILRMKMDMFHPNPQFWDLVAYRVLSTPHHRTKDEWCIYPTYDYTHCLCDSFEDITHSLCTTEFQLSRESYYWLVDALEIYKPVQWEYGRLNLTNTVLSKRKLATLVEKKIVEGWDDPRLYTLASVRRRGFTPEAINAFVRDIGVTTANTVIPVSRLENYVRDHLNQVSPRLMVVPNPLELVITNLPADHLEHVDVPNMPKNDAMGSRSLPFTRTLYIDTADFRKEAEENFFRLAPGKTVGLLHHPAPITVTGFEVDPTTGAVTRVLATQDTSGSVKPKAYIQWVARTADESSPVPVTLHLYDKLFLHENPMDKSAVPDGWLSDINPCSLEMQPGFADIGIKTMSVEDKFQALRVAYFCVDKLSNPKEGKFILNRTVSLKEDAKKD